MDEHLRKAERAAALGGPDDALRLQTKRAHAGKLYLPALRLPDPVWMAYQRAYLSDSSFITNYPPGDPRALPHTVEGVARFRPMLPVEFITVEFTLEPIE